MHRIIERTRDTVSAGISAEAMKMYGGIIGSNKEKDPNENEREMIEGSLSLIHI